ncbi:M23 family peptidase [Parabacteroides sp. 52]|uniref:M23 family metallopeptidase n=1 Tax=unclassified Parabacteroides TaxID=2649774 RepID=UPI0013D6B34E|nr:MULTISPECIES: M23 family metallopeptidase [unclassified Parabacteroides]MDH6534954.1 hypothetical protein [Parabacteroides sp. PM5-20]NDV55668.1 M23 family peptidase [Parabacteroides sp. 52]
MKYFHFATLLLLFFFGVISPCGLWGQELPNPLEFPIQLSGNFGELRSNHFHSGIDFKTQQVEGKPVHAVQEGYVSRISVSPWGYGNALYLTHPDGTTTVYAHLLRFAKHIMQYVKEQQYEQESFPVNLLLDPEQFPVQQGEVIALSGNTGSSGGPHLHFEVRDTQTEELMDPLLFYKKQIKDTTPPRIHGIMVYAQTGEGVVNGSNKKQEFKLINKKNGRPVLSAHIEAWGKIGLAVKAYDYMDNNHNIYGVKSIRLLMDSLVVFQSDIEGFALDDTRYLNSFTDYAEWVNNRSFYMKSFIEPGNRLPFLKALNRGYLVIDQERTYHLLYQLADIFGNTTELAVEIKGKKQIIPPPDPDTECFYRAGENRFGAKGIRLTIPRGNLYTDLYFRYKVKEEENGLAPVHILHDSPLALHQKASLSLRLRQDTLENKQIYGIVRIHNGKRTWIGGTYRKGWIDATIRELGAYTLAADTLPPTLTPIQPESWKKKQEFIFRLSDNLSGIKTYRGEIDGQYILFEMNSRSVIRYRLDKERIERGTHILTLTATDGCGNETVYNHTFTW